MNNKIIILTDERCGGTTLARLIELLVDKSALDDPTIRIENIKNNNDETQYLYDFFKECISKKYNFIYIIDNVIKNNYILKLSLIYDDVIKNIYEIFNYCKINDIKLIILIRKNIFLRAMSRVRCQHINNFDVVKKCENIIFDENFFSEELIRYNNYVNILYNELLKFNIEYLEIFYEDFYGKKSLEELIKYLNIDYEKKNNIEEINKLLNKNYHKEMINVLNIDNLNNIYVNFKKTNIIHSKLF